MPRLVGILASLALALGVASCTGDPAAPEPEPQPPADDLRLTQPRAVHRATVLGDGRVLVTGGCTDPGCGGFDQARRAEVYDPVHGFVAAAEMGTARASGSAILLSDGRVLLAGGYPGEGMAPTASAEVYDPVTDSFSPVAELATGRADHSATLMPDGRVLLAGGFDASGRALDTTEYFDPLAGRFTQGPELSSPRAAHVAVPVGREVVLVGGTEQSRAIAGTDVLRDGQWTRGPVLATPRVKLGAVPLGGSRILVVGGATDTEGHDRLDSSELVDLRTGVVRAGPRLSEGEYKLDGAVARLPDGRVVVGGGSELEVYDPGTDTFEQVAVPLGDATSFRTVTPVGPDTVLVAGGYDEQIVPSDFAMLVSLPVRAA